MRILLARHGETPWNAEGRYQGRRDIALSPVGEAQAIALGERLAPVPISRAVASPLARARRTAELALGEARACDGLGVDDTLLLVAHDAVNRVLLCRVLGLPLGRLWRFRQAPTTLNLLEGASVDTLDVVRLNDCSHHTPLFGEAVHRAL